MMASRDLIGLVIGATIPELQLSHAARCTAQRQAVDRSSKLTPSNCGPSVIRAFSLFFQDLFVVNLFIVIGPTRSAEYEGSSPVSQDEQYPVQPVQGNTAVVTLNICGSTG